MPSPTKPENGATVRKYKVPVASTAGTSLNMPSQACGAPAAAMPITSVTAAASRRRSVTNTVTG